MLWIGPTLGAVERACIRSVLRHGHRLTLHCYAPSRGVPEGVEPVDAAGLIPANQAIRHEGGSVSLFPNRFGCALQRDGRGIGLDCDANLLGPIEEEGDYLFGVPVRSREAGRNPTLRLEDRVTPRTVRLQREGTA